MEHTPQPAGADHPDTERFRRRNDELFGLRTELKEQLAVLHAKAESGCISAALEHALEEAERKFENVTEEIMILNYGLVRRYVALFTSRSTEHGEDFESAGKVGLLWAISSYDPSKGPFASWAYKPIQREVLRAVRDADHPNLNPGDFEKRPAIMAAERAFLERHGPNTPADYAEIAGHAQVSEAQVRRVLAPPRLDSLQSPLSGPSDDDVPWAERLADSSPSVEEEVVLKSRLHTIKNLGLPSLDHRERYVLTRRFGLDGEPEQSLRAIGEQLGLSREGVRQIQQKALEKLRYPFEDAWEG